MVIINKEEIKYLQSQGFKFGETIFKSHSRKPTYYCGEGKPLAVLNKYRKSKTIETVESN